MLTPRFSRARWLVLWSAALVWLGAAGGAGIGGCQGPDTFLRKDGIGVGGSGVGGGGPGLGGATGAGGRVGTGGLGAGGTVATGGRGAGGTVVGTGGTPAIGGRDGGAPDVPGTDGMATGGAPGMDAGRDADGGVVGTGPCAGLCANPISPPGATATSVPSTNQGTGATCFEVTGSYQGGNCGNFVAPRTFSVNGTVIAVCGATAVGGNFTLPATRVNGGYCFQASPGQFSYAYFGLF